MIKEVPIEMAAVPSSLRHQFTGKLPEAASGSTDDRELNFLSRSLAAYTVHKLSGCSTDEAVDSIVDGGGDCGIDALFYSGNAHTLWVVQSKFMKDGRGEPDLGSVTKFKLGLEHLLQGRFEAFQENEKITKLIPKLKIIFDDEVLRVRAILAYSGIHLVSEDRRLLLEDLKFRFSATTDYLQFQICNLTTIHDWLTGADESPGVPELELVLRKPGWATEPYETVYGLIPLKELAELYRVHQKRLIAANIRAYKGATEVNKQIVTTIREEPHHFVYLNNGLTAYCERLKVYNLDFANAEQKRVRTFGLSIVNGAQTLCSLAHFFEKPPEPLPDGYVFIKIISLERCEDDRKFAKRITHSTNFQNQIGSRDFVALDEQQERIANQLLLSGINYHYKDDYDAPTPDDTNFTLDEATTASACLAHSESHDFCSRILSNRRSLWSMEETYPTEEINASIYSRVFRPDRSARVIWRAVQTQRLVIEEMQATSRSSTGIRKAFFENSRWLVLNVVFLRLRPEQGDLLALSKNEAEAVQKLVPILSESLWDVCEKQGHVSTRKSGVGVIEGYEQTRHFRSVFSAATDCQSLRNALLAELAKRAAAIAPSTPTILSSAPPPTLP